MTCDASILFVANPPPARPPPQKNKTLQQPNLKKIKDDKLLCINSEKKL